MRTFSALLRAHRGWVLFSVVLAACTPADLGSTAVAASAPTDPLLDLASAELDRVMANLKDRPDPPYHLAYGLIDRHSTEILATHGSAVSISHYHARYGDVDLRVGSPELDNTHKLRDPSWGDMFPERHRVELPLSDDPLAVRNALWRATDDTYRSALRRLEKVRANDAVKVAREDGSADFTLAPPVVYVESLPPLRLDEKGWQDQIRAASAVFLEYPEVFDSNVTLNIADDVTYLINSEGTRVVQPHRSLRVSLQAMTIAEDGQLIQVYDYVEKVDPANLPTGDVLVEMAHQVARNLTALRHAPVVDPIATPAILRGRAAAVFFHEILGHRVEGHRQKDEDEGGTLADMVGQRVFPSFLSIYDDPTLARWEAEDLAGHYAVDDEGVRAERVNIVEDGVLKGFLMSRAPIENFSASNGHGRRQPGEAPVARQGNLIITAKNPVTYEALRARLIAEVKAQGKPFGLIFDDISGGFTLTGRGSPNSYAVQPVTVWRVWPDGRPDELVRGADLIGTPLVTFERILAASDRPAVFNGVCGAESGWVPVAGVAPDILVREVEVQRQEKQSDRPPLLPPPNLRPPPTKTEVPR